MGYWIRLGGRLVASDIVGAAPSAPTYETLADGGSGEASFELGLNIKTDPPLVQPGTLMEIFCGSRRTWLGRINDWDRESGQVVGRGIHTDAYTIPALDGSGAATRDLGTALATAAAAPWSWLVRNLDVGAVTATGDSTEPLTMGALMDQIAEQTGQRWGQGVNYDLFLRTDPTTPRWLASPGSSVFGATNEDRPTHLVGRYFDGTNNLTTVRGEGAPARAEMVDLTERGTLTLAQAEAILDANLARMGSRNGWVNGATLHREQITTKGGTPAALETVRAGTMVRALGVGYAGMGSSSPDVVIGKTRYTAGEDTIYIEPVNTAPRNAVDVWAA